MQLWKMIFIFTLLIGSAHGQTSTDVIPKSWPEYVVQSQFKKTYGLKLMIENMIFGGSSPTGLYNNDYVRSFVFNGEVDREVYDNLNLLNTWTVIDQVKVKVQTTPFSLGASPLLSLSPSVTLLPFAGVTLGARGVLTWRDVRQLSPSDVKNLTPIRQQKKFFGEDYSRKSTPRIQSQAQELVEDVNPYLDATHPDLYSAVLLHDVLNPLKLPFRMPLSRGDLKKMQAGELLSYNLSGQVVFGGYVGLKLIPTSKVSLGATANFEVHLNGEYEVAVLKEDDRFAKVRVSRLKGHGTATQLKVGLDARNLYNGFYTLGLRVIPFSWTLAAQHSKELSVIYRYDLETSEGRDAFHRAVLGSLVKSEELSESEASASFPTVAKVSEQINILDGNSRDSGTDLSIVYSNKTKASTETLTSEITDTNGKRTILRTLNQREHEANGLVRNDEKRSQRLSLILDAAGFAQNKPDSFVVVGENLIDNSSTSGRELNRYAHEVDEFFNESHFFPEFPEKVVSSNGKRFMKSKFGRSSFYFGFSLHENDLSSFLARDSSELAAEAEELGIEFESEAFENAREALAARNATSLYASLQTLFADRKHAGAWMKLIAHTLPERSYERFLVTHNQAYGSLYNRGRVFSPLENTLEQKNTYLGRGPETRRAVQDTEATVSDFTWTMSANDHVVLHFKLQQVPKYILFRRDAYSSVGDKTEEEVIVYNRDSRFKVGENTLEIDPATADPLVHKLVNRLHPFDQVTFTVAYARDEHDWGQPASLQLYLPKYKL